jgi:hypothetical protein
MDVEENYKCVIENVKKPWCTASITTPRKKLHGDGPLP